MVLIVYIKGIGELLNEHNISREKSFWKREEQGMKASITNTDSKLKKGRRDME